MPLARRPFLIVAATSAFVTAALAQSPPPARVRGTIDSLSGDSMVVTTRGGTQLTLRLGKNLPISQIAPIGMDAIKPGSFIGTAAVSQPDGTLRALEVQVFPRAMRGVGEGHRPWDIGANSSMTNGTVGNLKVADGRTLTLSYKGGEQRVFVPPDVPVITYLPGSRALLTPGAHIIAFVSQDAGGSLTATRIGVGRNGLVPPM